MTLDELYPRVTEAILRAEQLEETGPEVEAAKAYLTVSFLEEEIAELVAANEDEGAIARRGAVRAAAKAGVATSVAIAAIPSAAIPSGRGRPSDFGIYCRREGRAR